MARRRGRRGAGLAAPAAAGLCTARSGGPRARRPRRDRLRPRPGRLHRPAHGLLGGPGPGPRRRRCRCWPSTAWPCWPKTRSRAAWRRPSVWVAMDARMDEVYAAAYRRDGAAVGQPCRRRRCGRSLRSPQPGAATRRPASPARRSTPSARACRAGGAAHCRAAGPRRGAGAAGARGLAARRSRRCRAGAAAVPARQGGADDGRTRRAAQGAWPPASNERTCRAEAVRRRDAARRSPMSAQLRFEPARCNASR